MIADRFPTCLTIVLLQEGGWSNNPADPGGATNYGVTQATYDAYRRSKGLALQSVHYIENSELQDIYRTGYWDVAHCDVMPPPLDLCVFDMAVNSGPAASIKLLQGALDIGADGIYGSQTALAVAGCDPTSLAGDFCNAHEAFYKAIVARNPSQSVFLDGWMGRIKAIKKAGNITDD